MSGGGKKLNIWIGYSDLFSNLTTLLLVSALGVFAALGSGAIGIMGGHGPTVCEKLLTAVALDLKAPDSLLEEIDPQLLREDNEAGCIRYYQIKGLKVNATPGSLYAFRKVENPGEPFETANLRDGVCVPLWRMFRNGWFQVKNGRATVVGVAVTNVDVQYPDKQCTEFGQPMQISQLSTSHSAAFVIRDCQIWNYDAKTNPNVSFKKKCGLIENCKRKNSPLCRLIRSAELQDAQIGKACRKRAAEGQAKALFALCEGVPRDPALDDGWQQAGSTREAPWGEDRLQALWRQASFEGRAIDGREWASSNDDDRVSAAVSRDGSAIWIKLDVDSRSRRPEKQEEGAPGSPPEVEPVKSAAQAPRAR